MGVAVGQDESLVYVSNSNKANISVISAAEGTVERTIINVGNSPGNMLIPPGSGHLFVSNYGNVDGLYYVAAIDLTNDEITSIRVGEKPLGLASTLDGSQVFVANSGSNSISVISTTTLFVLNEISVGSKPTACAVTPDNNQLYVVNSLSQSISVIDIGSKIVIETISDIGSEPYDIAVYQSPGQEGRLLALITDSGAGLLKVLQVR